MRKSIIAIICLILFCPVLSGCGSAIRIYSIPSGANIYKNGVDTGLITPAKIRIRHLSVGIHEISVRKAGYRAIPELQNVDIEISVGNIIMSWWPPILIKNLTGNYWKGAVDPRRGRLDTFRFMENE